MDCQGQPRVADRAVRHQTGYYRRFRIQPSHSGSIRSDQSDTSQFKARFDLGRLTCVLLLASDYVITDLRSCGNVLPGDGKATRKSGCAEPRLVTAWIRSGVTRRWDCGMRD